jgi:hypothetical protein
MARSASLVPVKGKAGVFKNMLTGTIVNIVEWREDDKFDTDRLVAGLVVAGTQLNFFTNLGNKQLIDTNFTTPSRLPAGEEMIIDRAWCYIPSAVGTNLPTPQNIKWFAENAYAKFTINRKDLAEGMITKFPSGYGLSGNTVENAQGIVSIGVPSTAAAAKLVREQYVTVEHDLGCTVTFYARAWDVLPIVQPTTTVHMHLKAGFHGLVRSAATK